MEASEAISLLSLLQAAYPARDLTGLTGRLYVEALAAYDFREAETAIRDIIRHEAWCPSLAEIHEACTAARRERAEREHMERRQRALTDVSEFMALAPDEVKQALAPYWENFGNRAAQELRVAVERGDPEAKIEAGRRVAQRMIEAEADNEAEGQLKPLPKPGVIGRSSCGAAWGTPAEWDKAKRCYVCPSCRSPIRDGCNSSRESTG